MKTVELRRKRRAALAECKKLVEAAANDNRSVLNADEETRYDGFWKDSEDLGKSIKRMEALEAAEERLAEPIDPAAGQPDPANTRTDPATTRTDMTKTDPNDPRLKDEYRRAFNHFLRTGRAAKSLMVREDDSAIGREARDLQMDDSESGGFIVAPLQFVNELIQDLDDEVFIRKNARKFTVNQAESLGAPKRTARLSSFGWSAEVTAPSPDVSLKFGRRELTPHPCTGEILVSRTLIRRAVMSPEEIVRKEMARDAGEVMEDAYLLGDGAQKPLGLFVASVDGLSTARDVLTGSATGITSDGLKDAKFSLKQGYWKRATWLFHRLVVREVSKLKDNEGRYMWQDSIKVGEPDRLLSFPVMMSERTPSTLTTGLYVGLLGDFNHYWIADSLQMEIQRLVELNARTNQFGYIGRLETDGMPVTEEAFARLITD